LRQVLTGASGTGSTACGGAAHPDYGGRTHINGSPEESGRFSKGSFVFVVAHDDFEYPSRRECGMDVDWRIIPDRFRADVERAVSVLREHGAQEIYLFGSVVERFGDMEPDDIDIAVSGLPAESFLHAYGILLGELEHRFDLIDLDEDNRFSRRLRERGKLERVA